MWAHVLPSLSALHTAVKLDSRDTPPPLHFSPVTSEQERSSTADTTPIGTPKTSFHTFRRKNEKERDSDLLSSYYRRATGFAGTTSSYVDSALLESDSEDCTFPLFHDTCAPEHDMATQTAPMSFAPSSGRHNSPRRPLTSNLTSALRSTSANEPRSTQAMNISNGSGPHSSLSHRDSLSGGLAASGSYHGGGAQPISVSNANGERPRRESLASSMLSGMSFGGVSVGSFVRDEYGLISLDLFSRWLTINRIIMTGSSPFPQQSPSYHSSSYIPKMEANFMKDFQCCGRMLDNLHELLQHYEQNHAESLQQRNNIPPPAMVSDNRAAIASNTANAVRQSAQQLRPTQQASPTQPNQRPSSAQVSSNPITPTVPMSEPARTSPNTTSQHHPSLDMDAVHDMEMEDVEYEPQSRPTEMNTWGLPNQSRMLPRSQFGQPVSSRVPPLDTTASNVPTHLQQHQGLRNSTPTTPVTASRNGNFYQNNPTVSSVNTPTLMAHPKQKQQWATPDSSAPGTPGELDADTIGYPAGMDGITDSSNKHDLSRNQFGGFENFQFGNGNEMLDLCIDEPAKRLFSANGGFGNANHGTQLTNAQRLGDAQYSENSEIARTIREQQRLAGIPDGGSGPNDGVPKPFHCPVIGCEKAYKNHNGLKYHKTHGHNSQQIQSNENGTFSIVDPETLSPYPGTLGMEKHKPYRCDSCGKRYKNLNGLKYHKNHSAACEDGKQPTEAMEPPTIQPNPLQASHPPNVPQTGLGSNSVAGVGINAGVNMNNGFPISGLAGIDEDMALLANGIRNTQEHGNGLISAYGYQNWGFRIVHHSGGCLFLSLK
ncbi:MAG: hypothetical protein Q9218_003303 [Villophora microphyllina]